MDDLLHTFSGVVEGKQCSAVSTCTALPRTHDPKPLCAWHKKVREQSAFGLPCRRCESRNWVETPDAAYEAVCAHCELVTYDPDTLKHS